MILRIPFSIYIKNAKEASNMFFIRFEKQFEVDNGKNNNT